MTATLIPAAVVVRVDFTDGTSCPFSVSPSGRLNPCNGDGVAATATHWYEAARVLCAQHGFRPPGKSAAAPCSEGRTRWPWSEYQS